MTDVDKTKIVENQETKLKLMEEEMKEKSLDIDKKLLNLDKKEKQLYKKMKIEEGSNLYIDMFSKFNHLYDIYFLFKSTDEGFVEIIQSLYDMRKLLSTVIEENE